MELLDQTCGTQTVCNCRAQLAQLAKRLFFCDALLLFRGWVCWNAQRRYSNWCESARSQTGEPNMI
jgi:hypothetical protein